MTNLLKSYAILVCMLLNLPLPQAYSQHIYKEKQFQFLSFEKIPTWVGVVNNWKQESPQVCLYDSDKYKGHAQFVSVGLKTGINFSQFKAQVRNYESRKYMPFFLFDLRGMPLSIQGQRYTWAIRVEDYRYEDTTEQMAHEVLKLLAVIEKYIQQATGKVSKGIVILATNEKAKPNTSISAIINQEGYPNITRSQLLDRVGGKRVEILNGGVGIGYLKYIPAGQEKSIRPTSQDILIYEELPKRVPPVNGIITLRPQTPLSHINLLAKNRGTINLYATDLKFIPNAQSLMNKLVKIDCSSKVISMSQVSEQEAATYWAKHRIAVDIPQVNRTERHIIDLNKEQPNQTVRDVGAKAANYALIRQQFPNYVRKGFAIPFHHYFETITNSNAKTLIEQLVNQKPKGAALYSQLANIRKSIRSAKVSPLLLKELNCLIENQFNNERIRLRSSTNCEDLAEFNGAGLYESKGFNKADGDAKLEKKILKVYASLWNDVAYEERAYFFIDHAKAGMAILINQAFPDEYANGVGITMMQDKKLSAYINTQFGEEAVTNPTNGMRPETILFKSAYQLNYEVISTSSINPIFEQEQLQKELMELRKSLIAIHQLLTKNATRKQHTTYGVDIEFKLMKERDGIKLYIKQARLLRSILPK